jgi:hypothetical protein
MSAIEASRAADALGLASRSFATVLPAWFINPQAGRGHSVAPVVKAEFDIGTLTDPQFGFRAASGRICAYQIDAPISITFTQHYERAIDYQTWTEYCLAYQLGDTSGLRLPSLRVRDLRAIAEHAEWVVILSMIEEIAKSAMHSVRLTAAAEYGRRVELLGPQDVQDIIDQYVVSRRARNLIARSLKLRTFAKAGPYPVFRASIHRDLTDIVSMYVGDVKRGKSIRRIARSRNLTDPSELKQALASQYAKPIGEKSIATALLFMLYPDEIPVVVPQGGLQDQDVVDGDGSWPPPISQLA